MNPRIFLLPACLALSATLWSTAAFADDPYKERYKQERKFEEWAREDAKRRDEWRHEQRKREDEYHREQAKAEREYHREQRKKAEEYWRERDKEEAKAYREWLKDRRERRDREYYGDAYDMVEDIGRVIIGEPYGDY